MAEEKIIIQAKRKKKLEKFADTLKGLGFTEVNYLGNDIVAQRILGDRSSSNWSLDYKILFGKDKIEFTFVIPPKESKKKRFLSLFPVFLNAALLVENEYDIKVSTLFNPINGILEDFSKSMDKDVVDVITESDEIKAKYHDLSKKYTDLVRSSEENARLLLECERRRDELHQRTDDLEKLSDASLKEELYKWLKIRDGSIDMEEFCKVYNIALKRAEEGLNMLLQEGYIKKRTD